MATPRKFSEKIALHTQKQAEETAEFEKIMREVSDATNKVSLFSSFYNNLLLLRFLLVSYRLLKNYTFYVWTVFFVTLT